MSGVDPQDGFFSQLQGESSAIVNDPYTHFRGRLLRSRVDSSVDVGDSEESTPGSVVLRLCLRGVTKDRFKDWGCYVLVLFYRQNYGRSKPYVIICLVLNLSVYILYKERSSLLIDLLYYILFYKSYRYF